MSQGRAVAVLHVHSGNLFGGVERILETLRRPHPARCADDFRVRALLRRTPARYPRRRRRRRPPARRGADPATRPGLAGAPHAACRPGSQQLGRGDGPLGVVAGDLRTDDSQQRHAARALAPRAAILVRACWSAGPRARVPRWCCATADTRWSNGRSADRRRPAWRCTIRPLTAMRVGGRRFAGRSARGTWQPADAIVVVMAARIEAVEGASLLIEALAQLRAIELGGLDRRRRSAAGRKRRTWTELRRRGRRGSREPRAVSRAARPTSRTCSQPPTSIASPTSGPEPFGLSFVEALAAGLPVVTTRLGAAAEDRRPDSCGILIEPGSLDRLPRDAIAWLIDGSTRLRLGECRRVSACRASSATCRRSISQLARSTWRGSPLFGPTRHDHAFFCDRGLSAVACWRRTARSSHGLLALLGIGYVYGILRANFPDTWTYLTFDAGVFGLYAGQLWRPLHARSSAAGPTICASGWSR